MMSILLIDDNPDDLEQFKDLLIQSEPNVHTTSCTDGADGLAEVKRKAYDCVLLDLRLDGEDGVDVLVRLRAIRPMLPVIVLTGQGSEQAATDAFVAGAA